MGSFWKRKTDEPDDLEGAGALCNDGGGVRGTGPASCILRWSTVLEV